jgi:hypothetical protein
MPSAGTLRSHEPSPLQIGYCTNVHAGARWEEARANLERYALAAKRLYSPGRPMGVGLWLSAQAAQQLVAEAHVEALAQWLLAEGLTPFTLNGFPYSDFHQKIVKHRVYEPAWFQPDRLDYTLRLIEILDVLLARGLSGSISTLPIAWGGPPPPEEQLDLAASHLQRVARCLADLEDRTGRLITICLEPEPGCVLQRSGDVVRFFEGHLLKGLPSSNAADTVRRYIRVCHDVCHAAVMFEEQRDVLQRYRTHGIHVGKVQISSAVRVPLDQLDQLARQQALRQLAAFAEDRYLHQTMVRLSPDTPPQFYEDLPLALSAQGEQAQGEWRIHFHVPVYLQRFGLLETTQSDILHCLAVLAENAAVNHFEVETYAWGVLPAELQVPDLAAGIARELDWFSRTLATARR